MGRATDIELRDGILTIRQHRPDVLNARNEDMYVEIITALRRARSDDEVAAVLLSGSGRYFCAGMDFNDPRNGRVVNDDDPDEVAAYKRALPAHDPTDITTWLGVLFALEFVDFDKPLFAAVNGPAVGEGFSCLLHCDAIWAAETATFWAPFARAGAVPEFCATVLLPARLGTLGTAAMYLGRKITLEEALRVGFVTETVPAGDDFEDRVRARVVAGLELMGPPDLRAKTMATFKRLACSDDERARLRAQSLAEFSAIKTRIDDGDLARTVDHYAAQLPQRR